MYSKIINDLGSYKLTDNITLDVLMTQEVHSTYIFDMSHCIGRGEFINPIIQDSMIGRQLLTNKSSVNNVPFERGAGIARSE